MSMKVAVSADKKKGKITGYRAMFAGIEVARTDERGSGDAV